jgi:hypothetical protein
MTNSTFRLNDAQMLLLQLFQHRQMTSQELEALRDTLVKHLSQELDEEIEQVMQAKGITADDVAVKTAAINQHRTSYIAKARSEKQ